MDPYSAAALAGFQLINGLQNAEMIKRNAELNREYMQMNARFAELDALEALRQGYNEEARYDGTIHKILSSQNAIFASKDVDRTFGTAAEIQAETQLVGFLNKLKIQDQANAKALGYKRQALNIQTQGELNYQQGVQRSVSTRNAAFLNAGATFASGYGNTKLNTTEDDTGGGSETALNGPASSQYRTNFSGL